MYGLCFEGQRRWTYHFLLIIWLLLLAATPPKALCYFLGDTKAVLHGCEDHWTLQDRTAMPLLFQMTVCVDIRVTIPGAWVAFSYSSVYTLKPELGLEGDNKAVYGWLLRVRHRFPVELSPAEWHRVCLRRDVPRNSFSLEVDGEMVAARTVIAQAIPPSGSLWLGCQPRDRPQGAMLGEVELYMFRMWNDLHDHGVCEDGTVIGWSAQYWGLTSPRARQTDPNLRCGEKDHRRLRRDTNTDNASTTKAPDGLVSTTSPGPQLIICNITELCSKNIYFWMSISVNATGGNKEENHVQNLVSGAFRCNGNNNNAASNNMDFCQSVQVNCVAKTQTGTTTCDVLLQSRKAVSACEVQREGVSALQRDRGGGGGDAIDVKIIRAVERVGHCGDAALSSGSFLKCTSSLEDICRANNASTVTCSRTEPEPNPDPQLVSESCSGEGPRFCNCTAFCDSQRQFFATRINITSAAVNVERLQSLLDYPQPCATGSACQDILKYYKRVHLECHGTQERLFSCMVILEMSGSVDICSLNEFLQQLIGSTANIMTGPLTRILICGHPDLPVDTLLKSNLTWVDSDLLTSNLCQPDPVLLKCEANEVRAVLLNEGCPHTTRQTTTRPSTVTNTIITTTPEATTNATQQTYTEVGKTNASHSTVQPHVTTPLYSAINSTQSSTAQLVLQTSSQNTTSSSVNSILQVTTTTRIDSTLKTTTLSPNHITVYNETTADTSRPSPSETTTTTSNSTTGTFTPSPTIMNNVTTATKNYTTASNKFTEVYNITTAHYNWDLHTGTTTIGNTTIDTVTPSPNHTADYNLTITSSYVKQHNSTITTSNTTISTSTSSPSYSTTLTTTTWYDMTASNHDTTEFIKTTADSGNQQNGTTATTNATISTSTTSHTVVYNVTTDSNNATITGTFTPSRNYTVASNNYTTQYNVSTADTRNLQGGLNTTSNTTMSTFTSPNDTTVSDITTATKNYTTAFNNYTTADNNGNQQNGTTTTSNRTISTFTTPNPTVMYNVTKSEYHVTTPSNNYTTDNNVMTADDNNCTITTHNVTTSTFTTSPNSTMANNVTITTNNYTTDFNNYTTQYNVSRETVRSIQNGTTATTNAYNQTTTSYNATISTFTSSPNYTVMNNVTAATKNYTTVFNNYTTVDNVTTVDNNGNQQNATITSNTTISTYTASPNTTVRYSATTAANYTTQYNETTATNSNTTEYNVTTAGNIRSLQDDTTTTSNTTFNTSTPSSNHTAAYNVTTPASHVNQHNSTTSTTTSVFTTPNYTMASKITAASAAVYSTTADNDNGTITTISAFTPSPNYTMGNNATTVSHEYTPAENLSTMAVSQNNRATYKPTVAPLNNQTTNHTTAGVTNITTTNKNDTNSTTVANGNVNHNETAGIGLNLSTTANSLTSDLSLTTKQPVISLTTTVPSAMHDPPSTTTTTTAATTTTITSIRPITTKPATETTSTTTAKTTQSQEAQEEEANELLNQTQDASQLNSSQLAQLAGQLEKLLDGPTVSQAVGQKAVNIISNLMAGDSLALTASANRLIRVVDDLGLKLVVTGDKEIVSSNSLVLAVKMVDGTNFPMTVNIFNTDNVQFNGVNRSGSALGSVYLPSSLTTDLSPEEQRQASRVQFTFYTKSTLFQDPTLDKQTFVSPILGSSVANLSISNLSENIRFTIRNVNPLPFKEKDNYTASCVYWNFTLNDGRGGWSSNGCFVVISTTEGTTCSCNHLTSFAILLDLSRDGLQDRQQAQILTFITYIGCGLSAIFLAVTLLTYLSFEKLLRDIPAKILVQLCISLLLLNLLFLLDGWLALYPVTGLCISTAFFLHYFLLTSFTWAGLEALHMYLSVIRVFTPYLSRYMLKFSLMGWGIPLIVVIVVISVDKDNYGLVTYGKYTDGTTDDFCWLRNNIAFYVAVVGYFVLIFALCLLVFILVMVQLARIKRQNPQNQCPNRGVMTDMRSIAGLVILLGLTWGFALFAWGPLYLPFVYLFTIFNTLQGFLVFVFHCAVKENVRRQWRTYLCCARLRLPENSDWSRTATQNTRTMTMATATTSAPRHPSRSSSVISDSTNSNGSMFLDSGISDCAGSDVVLNELHRQNMSL